MFRNVKLKIRRSDSRVHAYLKSQGEERLTAHGVQSHQAANEIVKVHIAVLITIATDNHLVELVIQREACKTHTHTHT